MLLEKETGQDRKVQHLPIMRMKVVHYPRMDWMKWYGFFLRLFLHIQNPHRSNKKKELSLSLLSVLFSFSCWRSSLLYTPLKIVQQILKETLCEAEAHANYANKCGVEFVDSLKVCQHLFNIRRT